MSLEEAGIIGTVCVDSTGQFVPAKKRNGQLYRREGIAYLSNLAVDHNFRRQGIGRQLLDQAAEASKADDTSSNGTLVLCMHTFGRSGMQIWEICHAGSKKLGM